MIVTSIITPSALREMHADSDIPPQPLAMRSCAHYGLKGPAPDLAADSDTWKSGKIETSFRAIGNRNQVAVPNLIAYSNTTQEQWPVALPPLFQVSQ